MELKNYNIRVYGILKNSKNEILISKEKRFGKSFTKFPGGGHELGEGLKDTLKREFMEELGIKITVGNHLYTTDFLQVSAFDETAQLLSIYYWVRSAQADFINNGMQAVDLGPNAEHQFYWVNEKEMEADLFTYPIDQLVGKMISDALYLIS